MLHPDYANDDILICDPEGEFGALVKALGREKATVAHLVAGGKDRLNAMYMVEGYGEQNPIVEKSQFVMSLIEQIDKIPRTYNGKLQRKKLIEAEKEKAETQGK